MERTKLVVFNEHTLGYILPELPNYVQVLKESILRGATFRMFPDNSLIHSTDKVRLASEKDFDSFNVSMRGYKNLPEVYEFQN